MASYVAMCTNIHQCENQLHEWHPIWQVGQKIRQPIQSKRGPGSVLGIATGYRLDGPGIESRWGRDFPHLSRLTLRPTQPPVQRSFPGGKVRPGHDADPLPPSSAVGHERVELYLYSPYGPYSLYRASVPVQGCTLYIWNTKQRKLI